MFSERAYSCMPLVLLAAVVEQPTVTTSTTAGMAYRSVLAQTTAAAQRNIVGMILVSGMVALFAGPAGTMGNRSRQILGQ